MQSTRFLLLVVAALLMGAANLPVPDASAQADPGSVAAAVVPALVPGAPAAQVGAVSVAVVAADPLSALDVGQLAQVVQSPYGILLVAAGLVYLLLEIAKGLWLAVAAWPSARKRAVALLLGATVGGLLSLAGPVAWWIGVVAGMLGAMLPVAGRALGTGLRDGRGLAAVAVCILAGGIAVGSLGVYACSAGQVRAWQAAGAAGSQCYAECGLDKAGGYVQEWKGGTSINGEDVGWDALECLWPCLQRAGATLVSGLMLADAQEAAEVSAVSSALTVPERATRSSTGPASICKLKPELVDNSKLALRDACGCGDVPRCSVVIRTR